MSEAPRPTSLRPSSVTVGSIRAGPPGGGVGDRDGVEMPVHDDRSGRQPESPIETIDVGPVGIFGDDLVRGEVRARRTSGDDLHDRALFAAGAGDGDEPTGERHDRVAVDRSDHDTGVLLLDDR